jgi:hypothetical protein
MVGTTEGIRTTLLMSSGSEPSLNDDRVGVLTSEGMSPRLDENVSAVIYTDSGENAVQTQNGNLLMSSNWQWHTQNQSQG